MDLLILMGGIILLMVAIYKGKNIILVVPMILLLVIFLSGELHGFFNYLSIYVQAMLAFFSANALLFFLGVLLGAFISETQLALNMANTLINALGERYAVVALILLINIMMLGGISGFIIIFTIYPIALKVFNELNIPKRFIFGLIGVAMATYMIGAFPGSLQVQNIIPTMVLDSSIYSGFTLGLVLTVYLFITGTTYLMWRIHSVLKKEGITLKRRSLHRVKPKEFLVFLPLFIVLTLNLILSLFILPIVLKSNHQITLTAINISLMFGVLTTWLMRVKPLTNYKQIVYSSFLLALKPLLFVGTTFAFGSVISAMPFISTIKAPLLELNPYIALPLTVALFAGISGSATGGLSIAFPFLGDAFIQQINTLNINQSLLHRLAVMSSVTIDTLPTNGTTLTMLKVTNLTYKAIYFDYFMITVLNTSIATVLGMLLVINT
ncbi:MAG: hypothetical protein ACLFRI_01735 [Candidatus Izemoplasmataceae bacterium]